MKPAAESCLTLTTTENQGRVIIGMGFENQAAQDFGEVYIADDQSFSYCFPSEDLDFFTVRNEDGNSWVGHVAITHSDESYEALMLCTENCDCECNGLSEDEYLDNGCFDCKHHPDFELGIDNDDDVDGDTKCRFGKTCLFDVSWPNGGTLLTLSLSYFILRNS